MNRVNIFFHYAALQTWHFFFHLWAKKPSYAKGKKKKQKGVRNNVYFHCATGFRLNSCLKMSQLFWIKNFDDQQTPVIFNNEGKL